MKNKLISISISLMLIFTSIISTNAIASAPRIDLDEYQITTTDINSVYVSGKVSIAKGQMVGVYDSTGRILYSYITTKNTNTSESFKIKIPTRYISEGTNTYKIKSLPLKDIINVSNPKTFTVKILTAKKDQTITANDISLKVNETKNLGAKVSSGLSLTYLSSNVNIATVDNTGKVIGRKAGNTKITIKQAGNNEYNSVSKVINVTVKDNTPPPSTNKATYKVIFNPMGGKGSVYSQTIEVGKSVNLTANKFKRDGYTFIGWSTAVGRPIMSGTNVTKFKHVNMKHFQLGTVSYKNKASVKNLAKKGQTIQLYAVWKGSGPRAALDWGKLIADDNNFRYYTEKKEKHAKFGCYFCGDNNKHNNGKTYVCMTFVDAAYAHGANCNAFWSSNGTCNGTYIDGNSRISKIRKKNAIKAVWYNYKSGGKKYKYGKKPKMSQLKPGDILVTQKAAGGHVVMFWGKNSKGQYLMLECTHSSRAKKKKSGHIALHNMSSWYSNKCQAVFRLK